MHNYWTVCLILSPTAFSLKLWYTFITERHWNYLLAGKSQDKSLVVSSVCALLIIPQFQSFPDNMCKHRNCRFFLNPQEMSAKIPSFPSPILIGGATLFSAPVKNFRVEVSDRYSEQHFLDKTWASLPPPYLFLTCIKYFTKYV